MCEDKLSTSGIVKKKEKEKKKKKKEKKKKESEIYFYIFSNKLWRDISSARYISFILSLCQFYLLEFKLCQL
jgi:hypothetical protein